MKNQINNSIIKDMNCNMATELLPLIEEEESSCIESINVAQNDQDDSEIEPPNPANESRNQSQGKSTCFTQDQGIEMDYEEPDEIILVQEYNLLHILSFGEETKFEGKHFEGSTMGRQSPLKRMRIILRKKRKRTREKPRLLCLQIKNEFID